MERSPLEKLWFDFLVDNNIKFEEQVPVGRYTADFILNGNIDLEIDGLQHRSKKNILRDVKRDEYFKSQGYEVIRIPMNCHSLNKKKQQAKLSQQKENLLTYLNAQVRF